MIKADGKSTEETETFNQYYQKIRQEKNTVADSSEKCDNFYDFLSIQTNHLTEVVSLK